LRFFKCGPEEGHRSFGSIVWKMKKYYLVNQERIISVNQERIISNMQSKD